VVREGIEAAFKRFRSSLARHVGSGISDTADRTKPQMDQLKLGSADGGQMQPDFGSGQGEVSKAAENATSATKSVRLAVVREGPDGRQIREVYEMVGTDRRLVSAETVGEGATAKTNRRDDA